MGLKTKLVGELELLFRLKDYRTFSLHVQGYHQDDKYFSWYCLGVVPVTCLKSLMK